MQYVVAPTEEYLEHSAKGTTWKKHKYLKKENGKYYYPKKNTKSILKTVRDAVTKSEKEKNKRDRISANYKLYDNVKKGEEEWAKGNKKRTNDKFDLDNDDDPFFYFIKDNPVTFTKENIEKIKNTGYTDISPNDERALAAKEAYMELERLTSENKTDKEIDKEIDKSLKYIPSNNILSKALYKVFDKKIEDSFKKNEQKKENTQSSKIFESVSKAIDKVKDIKIDDIDDSITIFRGDDGKENFRVKYSAPTGNEKNNTKDLKKKTTKKSTTFFDDDDKERFKVKYH